MPPRDDKPKGGGPMSDLIFIVTGLVLLVILWYANGGPGKADLRGVFIQPPPPVSTGEAYGPTFGNGPTTTPQETPTDTVAPQQQAQDPNADYYVQY